MHEEIACLPRPREAGIPARGSHPMLPTGQGQPEHTCTHFRVNPLLNHLLGHGCRHHLGGQPAPACSSCIGSMPFPHLRLVTTWCQEINSGSAGVVINRSDQEGLQSSSDGSGITALYVSPCRRATAPVQVGGSVSPSHGHQPAEDGEAQLETNLSNHKARQQGKSSPTESACSPER